MFPDQIFFCELRHSIRITCPYHLIHPNLIAMKMSGEGCKLGMSFIRPKLHKITLEQNNYNIHATKHTGNL